MSTIKKKERKIFLSSSSKINSKTKVICILENSFLSMAPKVETIKKKCDEVSKKKKITTNTMNKIKSRRQTGYKEFSTCL